MERTGLLDCNNFFVSCERLFRPDLWKRPVAVLSSNDGCVVARSQEVKDLGIPMGVPYFEVRKLCEKEGVVLFSSNFTLYRDISSRVMRVLTELVPKAEVYSIDEAFFLPERGWDEAEIRKIKAAIERSVGIPVSIGIAPTKTLAKYASTKAKKGSGIRLLSMEEWRKEARDVPVGTVWGIGRQHTRHLGEMGVRTAAEFLALDPALIRREFGVFGERLAAELRGTPVFPLAGNTGSLRKSLASSRSFKKATGDIRALESALTHHTAHLAEKLREQGAAAGIVTTSIAPSRHGDYALRRGTHAVELPVPSNSTRVLLTAVLDSLRMIREPGVPYKKAGVTLGGIVPDAYVPATLFGDADAKPAHEVDRAADELNERFGAGTLRYASAVTSSAWTAGAALCSPEYTTRWRDIPAAKAAPAHLTDRLL